MRIGYFTSIEEWGGSETYLKSLMLGVRERGHAPVLFGLRGTRLWDECIAAEIPVVGWGGEGHQSSVISGESSVIGHRLSVAGDQCDEQSIEEGREDSNVESRYEAGMQAHRTSNVEHRTSNAEHRAEDCSRSSTLDVQCSLFNVRRQGGVPRNALKQATRCLLPPWLRLLIGNIRETRRLAALFKANRVDVMHVSVSGYEVAGLACRRVGIPTVAMNMVTPPEERYWARRLLMRYTTRRYTHVSSQSQYCTRRWTEFAGLRCDHCSFVWNGADLGRYRPGPQRTERQATDPFHLVSVGRLHPMKGYDVLVDALARLNDSNVALRILGEGPMRAELEAAIRKGGLTECVTLAGFHETPEKELAAADCFVLPSVSHESCPAVLAEAMACGLPLITSDFGPLAEVNLNGETGLVVPAGNADALSDAIARLKGDPALCGALGSAGLQRAQLFSREKMIEKTLGLYRAVLK